MEMNDKQPDWNKCDFHNNPEIRSFIEKNLDTARVFPDELRQITRKGLSLKEWMDRTAGN
jgi:hypothetical protein